MKTNTQTNNNATLDNVMDHHEGEQIEESDSEESAESEEEENSLQQKEGESLYSKEKNKEKASLIDSISPSPVLTSIAPNDSSRLNTG